MNKQLSQIAIVIGFVATATSAWAQPNSAEGCTIAGPSNEVITIEEYADFECSFCVRGANTMKQVLKDYPGKVKLIYRNMPLELNPNSLTAAKAFSAVCMQSSNLAYTFQNEIFSNQSEFINKGEAYLYEMANRIGVDVDQMKVDMAGPEVAKSLADDQQAARLHSFIGTPSFLIGTEEVKGAYPYDEIKKVIDRQLGN